MILAIIQARTSSKRLPGKVLQKVLGKPVIIHLYERLCHSRLIDKVVIATSIDKSDDKLVNVLRINNIEYFRGNLENVLDRFYRCAKKYNADKVVRITGDCPLIDSKIVDRVINLHISQGNDYTSNANPPSFPDGLDVEVIESNSLKLAWERAESRRELEHVTPFFKINPNLFKLGNLLSKKDYSKYRWTLDESEDLVLIKKIFDALSSVANFGMYEILEYLNNNEDILKINSHIERNEGSRHCE